MLKVNCHGIACFFELCTSLQTTHYKENAEGMQSTDTPGHCLLTCHVPTGVSSIRT